MANQTTGTREVTETVNDRQPEPLPYTTAIGMPVGGDQGSARKPELPVVSGIRRGGPPAISLTSTFLKVLPGTGVQIGFG